VGGGDVTHAGVGWRYHAKGGQRFERIDLNRCHVTHLN
jgi:hypothetical protein